MLCYEILRNKGYRLTPQRLLIMKAIYHANNHISAEEIYKQLNSKYPYANISTVYRTLELLSKLHLVTESKMEDGRLRYHAAVKGHHHHLLCQSCGKVIKLDESALKPLLASLSSEYGFTADIRHLVIYGECHECSQKEQQANKPQTGMK